MGFLDWFRSSPQNSDYMVRRVPEKDHNEFFSPSTHEPGDSHPASAENRLNRTVKSTGVKQGRVARHVQRTVFKEVCCEGYGPLTDKLIKGYSVGGGHKSPMMGSGSFPHPVKNALSIATDIAALAIEDQKLSGDPEADAQQLKDAADEKVQGFARRLPWNRS